MFEIKIAVTVHSDERRDRFLDDLAELLSNTLGPSDEVTLISKINEMRGRTETTTTRKIKLESGQFDFALGELGIRVSQQDLFKEL